jgi:peptidoglycan/LPS O-acetylase OafA/YrhL
MKRTIRSDKIDMHRKNNFDFLRLLFASFVVITHSYVLSGLKNCDWLCQITGGQVVLSNIGVSGFFIISGFFIFRSVERTQSPVDYYRNRFLRLYPALLVVLSLTVLLTPFVYDGSIGSYFKNGSARTYIFNNLSLYGAQGAISGVFENNPYKNTINGSLWTIPYEFTMYVVVSFFFFIRTRTTLIALLLLLLFSVLLIGDIFFLDQIAGHRVLLLNSRSLLTLSTFFMAGALLAAVKIENFIWGDQTCILAALLFIASLIFHFFEIARFITLPILVIGFGIRSTPVLNSIGEKLGDLSYGVYIYAFPVQQTLEYYFKFNYWQLMLSGIVISYLLAYASWHLIEVRALKLKKQNLFLPST